MQRGVIDDMTAEFVEEGRELVDRLRSALAEPNPAWADVLLVLHTFKGNANAFGHEAFSVAATELHDRVRQSEESGDGWLRSDGNSLCHEFAEVAIQALEECARTGDISGERFESFLRVFRGEGIELAWRKPTTRPPAETASSAGGGRKATSMGNDSLNVEEMLASAPAVEPRVDAIIALARHELRRAHAGVGGGFCPDDLEYRGVPVGSTKTSKGVKGRSTTNGGGSRPRSGPGVAKARSQASGAGRRKATASKARTGAGQKTATGSTSASEKSQEPITGRESSESSSSETQTRGRANTATSKRSIGAETKKKTARAKSASKAKSSGRTSTKSASKGKASTEKASSAGSKNSTSRGAAKASAESSTDSSGGSRKAKSTADAAAKASVEKSARKSATKRSTATATKKAAESATKSKGTTVPSGPRTVTAKRRAADASASAGDPSIRVGGASPTRHTERPGGGDFGAPRDRLRGYAAESREVSREIVSLLATAELDDRSVELLARARELLDSIGAMDRCDARGLVCERLDELSEEVGNIEVDLPEDTRWDAELTEFVVALIQDLQKLGSEPSESLRVRVASADDGVSVVAEGMESLRGAAGRLKLYGVQKKLELLGGSIDRGPSGEVTALVPVGLRSSDVLIVEGGGSLFGVPLHRVESVRPHDDEAVDPTGPTILVDGAECAGVELSTSGVPRRVGHRAARESARRPACRRVDRLRSYARRGRCGGRVGRRGPELLR